MKRLLILPLIALTLMGCPRDKNGNVVVSCPTLRHHDPLFWDGVLIEMDIIGNKAPKIMQLLDEARVDQEAIAICIKNQKELETKGKKKKPDVKKNF